MGKTIIIIISVCLVILIVYVVSKNIRNTTSGAQTSVKPMAKIVQPKSITTKHMQTEYFAPNTADKPSEVVAKIDDKIIWDIELSRPDIKPNLEKDVQILDYFVTRMRIDKFKTQDGLHVTLGDGIFAKTYILNPKDGELLNLSIVSPPPAK